MEILTRLHAVKFDLSEISSEDLIRWVECIRLAREGKETLLARMEDDSEPKLD